MKSTGTTSTSQVETLTASEKAQLKGAHTECGTGFMKLEAGGTLYFVEGNIVSKEEFILRSSMDHLLDDSSSVKCSKCGRHSVAKYYKTSCGMPQPSGEKCGGVFY